VSAQPGDGQRDEHGENPLAIGAEPSELAVLCCFNAEYLRRRARDWRRVDVVLSIIAAVLKLLTQRCNEAFKLITAVSFTLQAARARRGAMPRKVLAQCLESSGCGQVPTA
jgi:hypothetical protein